MPLWKLVAYRLKIALAGLFRGRGSRIAARLIGLAGLATLLVLLVMGAHTVFAVLAGIGPTGIAAASAIVLMTFNVVLVLALVFDILTTTGIFFLSSDLGLLIAAPLPTYKVFAVKYLEAMAAASFVSILVGLPVFAGFGLAFHASAVFYVAMVAVMAIFITIPVSAGTICGMVVSRLVPAARVKEALAVLSGGIGIGLYIALQIFKPTLAKTGDIQNLGARLEAFAKGGAGGLLGKLPSRFPADVLNSLAAGRPADAVLPLVWLVFIAGVMLAVSLAVAQRMYLTGWTRITPAARRQGRARRSRRDAKPGRLLRVLPTPERPILETTAHLFLRDAQQIVPVATLTIMMAILPFFMGRGSQFTGLRPPLLLFAATTLAFIGSLNLAMNAVVIDGRAFWWLLIAPRRSMRKLLGKLVLAVDFFVPLVWALLAGFAAGGVVTWSLFVKGAWLALWSAALGSAIGVLMGLTFADWEWDIPKRMIKTGGRLLLVGVAAGYFLVSGFALGIFRAGGAGMSAPGPGWRYLVIAAAGSTALAWVVLMVSARKMDRMEWPL